MKNSYLRDALQFSAVRIFQSKENREGNTLCISKGFSAELGNAGGCKPVGIRLLSAYGRSSADLCILSLRRESMINILLILHFALHRNLPAIVSIYADAVKLLVLLSFLTSVTVSKMFFTQ